VCVRERERERGDKRLCVREKESERIEHRHVLSRVEVVRGCVREGRASEQARERHRVLQSCNALSVSCFGTLRLGSARPQ